MIVNQYSYSLEFGTTQAISYNGILYQVPVTCTKYHNSNCDNAPSPFTSCLLYNSLFHGVVYVTNDSKLESCTRIKYVHRLPDMIGIVLAQLFLSTKIMEHLTPTVKVLFAVDSDSYEMISLISCCPSTTVLYNRRVVSAASKTFMFDTK